MPNASVEVPREWRTIVTRLQFEIRLGWFWDTFLLWFIAGVTLGAMLTWTLRSGESSWIPGLLSGAGLLLVGALLSLESMNRRNVSLLDCLSRLDDGWGMGQKLTRAYAMDGTWPAPPVPQPRLPVQVNTSVWGMPVVFVLLCVGLAVWVPPVLRPVIITPAKAPPPAWTDVEQVLDVLEEEIVEPESLADLKQALEELKQSPETDWYTQSGLEATDRLKEQVSSQSQQLMDGMNQMAQLLEQSRMAQQGLAPREGLDEQLREMLQQMGDQPLSLSQEQLQQLRTMDLSQVMNLDANMLKRIEAELRAQCRSLEGELASCGLLSEQPGGRPDGGGAADLGIDDTSSLGWGEMPVLLEFNPEEKMDIGDQLEEREIEHEEAVEFLERRAGSVSSEGEGGSAVWRQELVPAEQQVLQQFFDSKFPTESSNQSP